MTESRIIKLTIAFVVILLLAGGFFMWNNGWLARSDNPAPGGDLSIFDKLSLVKYLPEIGGFDQEKTYLLLFQNNLEIRPSGGYLGNFGILKVANGKPTKIELHDTNIFDGFGKDITEPTKPLADYLGIKNWQMRDSNWYPDFQDSAKQAEYFYRLQGGQEQFDGIIAINAIILPRILALTGPIYLEKYDAEFTSENALYELEHQVEQAYVGQGISDGERKSAFKDLVKEVIVIVLKQARWNDKQFQDLLFYHLAEKQIQLYFKNEQAQQAIEDLGWAGQVNKTYSGNYLMINEANLAAKKSNFYVDRSIDYYLDLTNPRPEVTLTLNFKHRAQAKDWFTDDYRCYLRIYTPQGSWLVKASGITDETMFSQEYSKEVFANWITVGTGEEKSISYTYLLPEDIDYGNLNKILIQKQSGIDELPINITIKDKFGNETNIAEVIKIDREILIQ